MIKKGLPQNFCILRQPLFFNEIHLRYEHSDQTNIIRTRFRLETDSDLLFFERFEDTHFLNGVVRRPE